MLRCVDGGSVVCRLVEGDNLFGVVLGCCLLEEIMLGCCLLGDGVPLQENFDQIKKQSTIFC